MLQALAPTFDGERAIPSSKVTEVMVDCLGLQPKDKLLEVGTGSGSQTAEFAKSGAEIHSIELEPVIDAVDRLGCTPIYLHSGDGTFGLEQEAPFTAIVATCGVTEIPKAWKEQLAEEGRLLCPIGDKFCQKLTLFKKRQGELYPQRVAAYVRFQMIRAA